MSLDSIRFTASNGMRFQVFCPSWWMIHRWVAYAVARFVLGRKSATVTVSRLTEGRVDLEEVRALEVR